MRRAARGPAGALQPAAPAPAALASAVLAAALALSTAAPSAAQGVELRATLEPEMLAVGETARFSIVASGGVMSRVSFRPRFELDNLTVVAGPSRSENLEYVNGNLSRSLALTWYLRPEAPGAATVHSIAVEIAGERFDLPAAVAEVLDDGRGAGPGPPRRAPDPLERLFERYWPAPREHEPEVALRAEVSDPRPWEGQQVLYTLWLYTRNPITAISPRTLPDFRGFWVEEIPREENAPSEPAELGGERYWRTALLRRALFPLRPGRYEIEPAVIDLVATVGSASPFRRSLPRSDRLTRASGPVVVDVRPLPPPPPELADDFSGLVGDLSLAADLAPADVRVGEAALLELRLSGRGNVGGLGTPAVPAPDGVAVLPPEEQGEVRQRRDGVEGIRTWSYPLVADRPGTWRLPPVEMAYFDPVAGEYRVAATRPLVMRAKPGAAAASTGGRPALHPIRNAALPLEDGPGARFRRWLGGGPPGGALPWLFAAPWATLLAVVLLLRRNGLGRDGGSVQQPARLPPPTAGAGPPANGREALRRFDERLAATAGDGRPRQAAREIEDAWRELLGAIAGVGAETPASRWPEHAAAAGARPCDADELGELVEDVHYLRYAPQLSTIAALRGELVDRSRRLARRLVP